MPHKLSIIIVHWNTPALLEKQLELLHDAQAEIIVVDNASETSLQNLKKKFPTVRFVENRVNRGFSFACNQGVRQAEGSWVLFLNPDTHITPTQIDSLVAYGEDQKLVAVSPNLSSQYQKPVPSFWSLFVEFSPLHRFIPLSMFSPKTLAGGCLLMKKEVLEKLGGWDERFFVWFEDSDLSKRLLDGKHHFGVMKELNISHEGASSFASFDENQKRTLFFLSLKIYAAKYFSTFEKMLLFPTIERFAKIVLLPQDSKISVSLVVPNLKQDLLEKFLAQNYQFFDFRQQELIVVTSADDIGKIRQKYPETIFIHLQKNNGFAQTVNIGLCRARGKLVGTVNDDTVLNKSWLEIIVQEAQHRSGKIGSFSPVIYNAEGEVESAGISVLPFGRAETISGVPEKNVADAFNGAAVLFNRQALEEVGLFDEKFGSYLEDIDLGLRLKNHGWQNCVVPEVKIQHHGQQTSKSRKKYKAWLDAKNWWLVMIKNYSLTHWLRYLPQILLERGRNASGFLKHILTN